MEASPPAVPSRRAVVAAAKGRGLSIAAVLPFHYPRALLRAYGYLPIEVWGPPHVDPAAGDGHFQAYACALVRNAAAFLLRGGLEDAGLLLVPHTCDALQGFASVARDFLGLRMPVATIYVPRGALLDGRLFLTEELRGLASRLGEITGRTPSSEELHAAIDREQQADARLAELARNRRRFALGDRDFYTILRSREYLPAEEIVALAEQVPEGNPPDGVPLMISGIVPEPMELFDVIADAGGAVIADDLACIGRRLYPPTDATDPFVRMAASLLGAPVDATRCGPIRDRAREICLQMQAVGARGLIVYTPKFCEPQLFTVPDTTATAQRYGFPVLHLEFEMGGLSQQLRTRIEAFVEMLT